MNNELGKSWKESKVVLFKDNIKDLPGRRKEKTRKSLVRTAGLRDKI
jgi:hypothetical protein